MSANWRCFCDEHFGTDRISLGLSQMPKIINSSLKSQKDKADPYICSSSRCFKTPNPSPHARPARSIGPIKASDVPRSPSHDLPARPLCFLRDKGLAILLRRSPVRGLRVQMLCFPAHVQRDGMPGSWAPRHSGVAPLLQYSSGRAGCIGGVVRFAAVTAFRWVLWLGQES